MSDSFYIHHKQGIMMLIKLNDRTFVVKFMFDECKRELDAENRSVAVNNPRSTYCSAYYFGATKELPLASASATCGEGNQFARFYGKRVAFTRLLKALALSKEERTLAWSEFKLDNARFFRLAKSRR